MDDLKNRVRILECQVEDLKEQLLRSKGSYTLADDYPIRRYTSR